MELNPGYWRYHTKNNTILECVNKLENRPGGYEVKC